MLLTLSKKTNQWLGKFLLKHGIKARFALSDGVMRDHPRLDAALLLPLAMRLVSLESYDQGQVAVNRALQQESIQTNKTEFHTPESLGEIRLQVLESYLRPALLPNEQWSDVCRWRFHQRLVKWARKEYLMTRYRDYLRAALTAFPAMRQSPQLASSSSRLPASMGRMLSGKLPFDDNSSVNKSDSKQKYKLPSSKTVRDALDLHDWTNKKDHAATGRAMTKLAQQLGGQVIELHGGAMRFADIPPDACLSELSLQDVLEVAGAHVATCGPLNALCEQADVYQLWTREYIDMLGAYLLKRTSSFEGDTVVLEVGAGNGLLSASLAEYLEGVLSSSTTKRQKGQPQSAEKVPLVVATDDKSWGVEYKTDLVRTMSVQQAIEAFPANDRWQVIVLCSWMPMNEDWTAVFRKHNVDEYILIGECDNGQCGENWLTWGNVDFLVSVDEDEDDNMARQPQSPLFELDGYIRKNMDALSSSQFGRFDCKLSKLGRTVSFRRRR